MRLWSLHPRFLDRAGLCGLWREALLAQAVLADATVGYRNHPQLQRFRQHPSPRAAIATYLDHVAQEGSRRGYRFDVSKIGQERTAQSITVSEGQLQYEWERLRGKLRERDPQRLASLSETARPEPHPLFVIVHGGVESWEVGARPKETPSPAGAREGLGRRQS